MSERGVFAVDRGIWDHDLFQESGPLSRREAWLWLLSEAAWRAHRRRIAGRSIELKRGQIAASLRFIASKWRWSEPRVRRFLSLLRIEKMIDAHTDAGVSVISICKYDEYQRVSLPSDAKNDSISDAGATQERRKGEDREDKEVKKTTFREKQYTGAVADATRPNAGKVFDEEFWPTYPKRDGANPRKPARDKFLIAVKSGHDPQAIVSGARRYAEALAKSNHIGTKYVAQAVTWINQARWEDYPPEASEPTGPPKPPDPSLPSHEEMIRRYGGQNASTDSDSAVNNHEGKLRREGDGVHSAGGDGQEQTPDDQSGFTGVRGLGKILPGSSWIPAMGTQGREVGRDRENDGPGSVA